VPRETNLTDLADELDITRQSLSRRMARGQRTLLNNTLLRESPANK
jgi:predicted DNA binding protein